MPAKPVITFIGAGSTVLTKNIAGDILQRPALALAEIRLMVINVQKMEESEVEVCQLAAKLGGTAKVKTCSDQRKAPMTGNREHIHPAAMLDPHTAAEVDPQQVWDLVDGPIETHGNLTSEWSRKPSIRQAA